MEIETSRNLYNENGDLNMESLLSFVLLGVRMWKKTWRSTALALFVYLDCAKYLNGFAWRGQFW